MPAPAPAADALFDLAEVLPPAAAQVPPALRGKVRTVLSYGLGADSTAILLGFLEDPARYGLEADLSDLVVVHAVTGEEWPDSLTYVERHVLPRLRAAGVRLVQIARGGPLDSDGVVILDDSRAPSRVHAAGPWRLSDELGRAGTVPQIAGGRRTCSIRFKGWCLDAWAVHEFGTAPFRRVIGYHYGEVGRAEKDTAIQRRLNREAGRTICEPVYPLIEERRDRAAVEAFVLARTGEMILKSYCSMCPFSGVCASRERHEERLRAHPHIAAQVLRLEYTSMALNEHSSLYGTSSLWRRLTEDGRNDAVLDAFDEALDQTPHAVYEVRRVYLAARTPECRELHGKRCTDEQWWCRQPRTETCRRDHPMVNTWRQNGRGRWRLEKRVECGPGLDGCRGPARKGKAWRSVRTVWEGSREECERVVRRFAARHGLPAVRGEVSGIRRAHYLQRGEGYPSAEGYLVAAPVGVADKQRPGFEKRWAEVTGRREGPWCRPVREYTPPAPERGDGRAPVVALAA